MSKNPTNSETENTATQNPFSRRGLLTASAFGLWLAGMGTASANHEDDGDPFADEGHDHHDDYLGEHAPVNRIDATQLTADEFYRRRVYDTAGNYYDELTGENDATVVQKAIDNRPGEFKKGPGIVVPDPGFPLDWNQQLNIPGHEHGFHLVTVGQPALKIPGDFDGKYALFKPAAGGRNYDVKEYYIGPIRIDDRDHNALEEGMRFNGLKRGYIDRPVIEDAPGISIRSNGPRVSTTNVINNPFFYTKRGPGIVLEEAYLNWVYSPSFVDRRNFTETAYVDKANWNQWIYTHCEHANTVHVMENAKDYRIIEGDWDRQADYEHTIEERGKCVGYATVRGHPTTYAKIRITNAHTKIDALAITGMYSNNLQDLFSRLSEITPADVTGTDADSFAGLTDSSTGSGTAGYIAAGEYQPLYDSPEGRGNLGLPSDLNGGRGYVVFDSGAMSGSEAVLNQGGNALGPGTSAPKLVVPVQPDASSDTEAVLVRVGIHGRENDRCEFIYDPENVMGNHSSDNWYWELATNDTVRASVDTGKAPTGDVQRFVVQRETRWAGSRWSGHIYPDLVAESDNGGEVMSPAQARVSVRTLADAAKTWMTPIQDGVRLWAV